MKILIVILSTLSVLTATAQQTTNISNSFEDKYRRSNPTFIYSYDSINQIHNYSNNWDLDKDGIKDEVYFIGTGGAHLYYFLKVVLSSDKRSKEFKFIQSDFPLLTAINTSDFDKTSVGFVVAPFNNNLAPSIIIRLDESSYQVNKKLFNKLKVNTKNIVVRFENGKTKYSCL